MRFKLILIVIIITSFYILNTMFWQDDLANYATLPLTMTCAEELPSIYNIVKEINFRDYFTGINTFDFPPFYYITASIAILIFGKHWYLMNLVNNTFYLLILLIFSYLLGKEIKDKETGLIFLIIIALYPLTYESYQFFSMDFALMGAITMSAYLFYKTIFFESLFWSIMFGISCGFGMMIKDPFGAFIIGPILYGFFKVIRKANKDKKPLINFSLFCLVFYIIIYPFYFTGPFHINKIMYKRIVEESPNIPWYSFENLRLFTTGLWESQLSPPFFIVFILGIYYFLRKTRKERKIVLLFWIVIPNIIILFMPHWKTSRYLMPQLPALAIVSAFWIQNILNKWYGKVIFLLLILIGIFQYYEFTYGIVLRKYNYNEYCFKYYDGSDIFEQRLHFKKEITSLSLNAIERALRNKIAKTNHNISNMKKYCIFNPFSPSPQSLPIDQYLNGYFWYNDINAYTKNFRNVDNLSVLTGVHDDLENIDFILNISSDIDLQNPAYFNEMKQEYLRYQCGDQKSNNISETEWSKYENIWNNIISNFRYKTLIYSTDFHDKHFNIFIYSRN